MYKKRAICRYQLGLFKASIADCNIVLRGKPENKLARVLPGVVKKQVRENK
jgi:hypothetical protein